MLQVHDVVVPHFLPLCIGQIRAGLERQLHENAQPQIGRHGLESRECSSSLESARQVDVVARKLRQLGESRGKTPISDDRLRRCVWVNTFENPSDERNVESLAVVPNQNSAFLDEPFQDFRQRLPVLDDSDGRVPVRPRTEETDTLAPGISFEIENDTTLNRECVEIR
jgi:hypothetical protein